jgi:hypothetical protein
MFAICTRARSSGNIKYSVSCTHSVTKDATDFFVGNNNYNSKVFVLFILACRRIRSFTCTILKFYSQQSHGERTSGYEWLPACFQIPTTPSTVRTCDLRVFFFSVFLRCHETRPRPRKRDTVSSVHRTRVSEEDEVVALSAGVGSAGFWCKQAGLPVPPRPLWGSSTRFTSTRSRCPQLPPPRCFSRFAVKHIAAPAYLNYGLRRGQSCTKMDYLNYGLPKNWRTARWWTWSVCRRFLVLHQTFW